MIVEFIKPFLAAAALLLAVGPAPTAQDPKDVKTAPKDAKPVTKATKKPSKPVVPPPGNPMLGDQYVAAPPAKPKPFAKTGKKPKKLPYEQRVDLNNASKEDLKKLQGITDEYAAKIIAGRPYRSKAALVVDKVIPTTVYFLIKDKVAAGKVTLKKP
jgi:DNA uptake protein ComE-like DNA-binding protein